MDLEKAWRQALGEMTYGIYALTTFYEDHINGMIASWVSQISYDPPLVMVAVHPNRYSHHLIQQSGHFALHVLPRSKANLLERFKGSDPAAKFKSIHWHRGKTGCPILKDCIAFMECEVKATFNPGNHSLFIGEIKEAKIVSQEEEPLSTFDYAGVYLGRA